MENQNTQDMGTLFTEEETAAKISFEQYSENMGDFNAGDLARVIDETSELFGAVGVVEGFAINGHPRVNICGMVNNEPINGVFELSKNQLLKA